MGPGIPLSTATKMVSTLAFEMIFECDTLSLKDHLKSDKRLFNVVIVCKWQPAEFENGSIAHAHWPNAQ